MGEQDPDSMEQKREEKTTKRKPVAEEAPISFASLEDFLAYSVPEKASEMSGIIKAYVKGMGRPGREKTAETIREITGGEVDVGKVKDEDVLVALYKEFIGGIKK